MSKQDTSLANILGGDISKGIDFDKVFKKAVDIFSDQALLDKRADEISLRELEISRAKANNFLDAIGGIMEIGHQVEVMSADKDKFRRGDELRVLNSLRRGCEISSNMLEKNLNMVVRKMETLENREDIDVEEIAMVQGMLQQCIESSQKVIASMSRLVQLERVSGSRPWGQGRSVGSQVSIVEKLEKGGSGGPKSSEPPREISWSEIKSLENA